MKLNVRSIRNDLYADDVKCVCPSKKWIGTDIEHLMQRRISLNGYNDSNFFDNVNKKPRIGRCNQCGREYKYQWFRYYVEFEWLDEL